MEKKNFLIEGASQRMISMDMTLPEKYDMLVIFAHGFKGFKDWGTHHLVADYFAKQGLAFLKFNFSHNGITSDPGELSDLEAFSSNTFSKELFDLDAVLTFASSGFEFPAPKSIALIGHSLGGGICIVQASEDKRVKKLITWASVSRFKSLWMTELEEQWHRDGVIYVENSRTKQQMPLKADLLTDLEQHANRLDILAAARKIKQPWLIVHSEADASVPIAHALELSRQQSRNNMLIISDSDHVFGAKHPWNEDTLPATLQRVCDVSISFLKE